MRHLKIFVFSWTKLWSVFWTYGIILNYFKIHAEHSGTGSQWGRKAQNTETIDYSLELWDRDFVSSAKLFHFKIAFFWVYVLFYCVNRIKVIYAISPRWRFSDGVSWAKLFVFQCWWRLLKTSKFHSLLFWGYLHVFCQKPQKYCFLTFYVFFLTISAMGIDYICTKQ